MRYRPYTRNKHARSNAGQPSRMPRALRLLSVLVSFFLLSSVVRVHATTDNWLTNPAFETGSLVPWGKYPPGALGTVGVTSDPCCNHTPGGGWSAYIKPGFEFVEIFQNITGLKPGESYYLEAWVSTNGMTALLQWHTSATGQQTCGSTSATSWVRLHCNFTVPAGISTVAIIFAANAAPGRTAIIDDVYVTRWPLHAGNKQPRPVYGVKADITSPSTPPPVYQSVFPPNHGASTISGWVSGVGDGWVQTGWQYCPECGHTGPMVYTEATVNNVYQGKINWGTIPWGTTYTYRVENDPGTETWRAYLFNGQLDDGWGPIRGRIEGQALGESWGNTRNQINTAFSNVYWRDTGAGSWGLFDRSSGYWVEQTPYYVQDKSVPHRYYVLGSHP